jgi:hypothetical protein
MNLVCKEWKNQRAQLLIFDKDTRKYKLFVFTEYCILMLSSILNSSTVIHEAITSRKAGEYFYTADKFMAHMKTTIAEGKGIAPQF